MILARQALCVGMSPCEAESRLDIFTSSLNTSLWSYVFSYVARRKVVTSPSWSTKIVTVWNASVKSCVTWYLQQMPHGLWWFQKLISGARVSHFSSIAVSTSFFWVCWPGFRRCMITSPPPLSPIWELKQATFLTARTSWSKKAELWLVKNVKFIFVRVVKNVVCLSSLLSSSLHHWAYLEVDVLILVITKSGNFILILLVYLERFKPERLKCFQTSVEHNITLTGGLHAGNFTAVGHVENIDACAKLCCVRERCDLALMVNNHCFLVRCLNNEKCRSTTVINQQFRTHIVRVNRTKVIAQEQPAGKW